MSNNLKLRMTATSVGFLKISPREEMEPAVAAAVIASSAELVGCRRAVLSD